MQIEQDAQVILEQFPSIQHSCTGGAERYPVSGGHPYSKGRSEAHPQSTRSAE